jgi:hypothetical protein
MKLNSQFIPAIDWMARATGRPYLETIRSPVVAHVTELIIKGDDIPEATLHSFFEYMIFEKTGSPM